jgi:hypothetical protein
MADGNDLLMASGGTPWAKWPAKGTKVTGVVKEVPKARQSRDIDTNTPAVWPDGEAKMEVVILIATDERDPDIEDDDGTRQVVLPKGSGRFIAVQGALKAAKANGILPGGRLEITYVKDGPKRAGSKFAPKEYAATYVPPTEDGLDALSGLLA